MEVGKGVRYVFFGFIWVIYRFCFREHLLVVHLNAITFYSFLNPFCIIWSATAFAINLFTMSQFSHFGRFYGYDTSSLSEI